MNEFIEKLKEKLIKNRQIGRKSLEAILLDIKQTEAEYNNGWIPCCKRLPDVTDDYLCQVGNWFMVLPYRKGQYAFFNKEGIPANVIAWQPLPAPYKKGE